MVTLSKSLIGAGVIALSACASTATRGASDFALIQDDAKIIILEPTADMGLITAGGVREARADWTETATQNLLDSFTAEMAAVGVDVAVQGADEVVDPEVLILGETVMGSVLFHGDGIGGVQPLAGLPTKEGNFDWTIGTAVAPLREQYQDADYAMLVFSRGDFASATNQVMQVGLGLLFGGIVVPSGGARYTIISLVDLEDGDMTWVDVRTMGDARNPKEAAAIVSDLVKRMPKRTGE